MRKFDYNRIFTDEMKEYIAKYHPTEEEATAALIRTGVLNSDGTPKKFICEHNFFETKIEPLKTFTFLRDWYINKYNVQPNRQGISINGDPYLVYKPNKSDKTDLEELYIETYEDCIGVVIKTSTKSSVEEFSSLEEFCRRFDEIMGLVY